MLCLSMLFLVFNTTISSAFSFSNEDTLKTHTVRVGNLHCNGDMPTIRKQLLNEDGIDEVRFTERNSESSEFTIQYHSSATSPQAIETAIEKTPGCDAPAETPYKVIHPRKKKNG